jgi:hypothetical protein
MPPTINSFWHGPALGPMAAACLSSFVRHGHPVVLHCYAPPVGVPAGVAVHDAEAVLPRNVVEGLLAGRHFAIASDLVRYEILGAGLGIWVDCDCYCVRPVADRDFLFAWEDEQQLGSAVLKLPPASPTLAALRAIREGFIPPWFPWWKRLDWATRPLYGRGKKLARMRWGTTGPTALTYFATRDGVADGAAGVTAFYPVHWSQVGKFLDEQVTWDQLLAPDTLIVHLFNEKLRQLGPAPPNSPLGRLLRGDPVIA